MGLKILITGAFHCGASQLNQLINMGLDIDFHKQEKEAVKNPQIYDAVICNALFLYNDIHDFVNLKYIQLTSAGLERVPAAYIKERGIELYNARGVYSIPMAEHVILKILELYKKSLSFYKKQEKHQWEKERSLREVSGKTAAVVGCGSVGLEAAKRLRAFDTKIIGIDVVYSDSQYIDESVLIHEMDRILPECDIVILTVPLTKQTYHMFCKKRFEKMKQESIFINISRGSVVCQNDLITALKNGRLLGAAIDVFEEEPLEGENPLWDMDNVIITPHNSFVGEGNGERLFELVYKNLKEWLIGHE